AAELGIADPTTITGVTAEGDAKKQAVTITAKAKTAEEAARTADAYSNGLLAELTAGATQQRPAPGPAPPAQDHKANTDLANFDNSNPNPKDPATTTQRNALQTTVDGANADLQKVQQLPAPQAPLVALDAAKGQVDTSGGLKAPNSKTKRAALLAAF